MTGKAKHDPMPELKKAVDDLVESCEQELLPALKKMQDAASLLLRKGSQIAERIKRSNMTR